MRKMSEINKSKISNMKHDAKLSVEKQEHPNGYVHAYVKGVKQFFPLDSVEIHGLSSVVGKITTIGDLVQRVVDQDVRIDKLVEINIQMNTNIEKNTKEIKRWIG